MTSVKPSGPATLSTTFVGWSSIAVMRMLIAGTETKRARRPALLRSTSQ